jgi:hypothetical protein
MDTISLLESYRSSIETFWKRILIALSVLLVSTVLAYYFPWFGIAMILGSGSYILYLFYQKYRFKKKIVEEISRIISLWNQGYRIAIYDGGDRVLLLNDELNIELGPYVVRISKASETEGMMIDFGYVFLNGSFALKYTSTFSELYMSIYLRDKSYTLIIGPQGIQEQGDKDFFEEHFSEDLEEILSKFKAGKLTVQDLIRIAKRFSEKSKQLSKL